MSNSHLMATYNRSGLEFVRGDGAWAYTADDTPYLDFSSGIAVNVLGHASPVLIDALIMQAQKLWHISNTHTIPEQEALASALCAASFADRVFFCNSGAEAVEGMIKTIRSYNADRHNIITFRGAFHGRTLATISAAHKPAHDQFAPLLPGFIQTDFDIDAVREVIDTKTAGIIIEPIQGEGGVRVMSHNFLRGLRKLVDAEGILLGFDEVQTGMGHTGTLFAYEQTGVVPDVMALAKGLGGGFPIGAVLAHEMAARGMCAGQHGSTLGGNPLAMAVGKAVVDTLTAPDFLAHVQRMGGNLRQGLSNIIDDYPDIFKGLRGVGLMIGLEVIPVNTALIAALRDAHMLVAGGSENVIRLLPPLIIDQPEIDAAFNALRQAAETLRHSESVLEHRNAVPPETNPI